MIKDISLHAIIHDEEGHLAHFHTHGLEEHYNHPDLQILLPLDQGSAFHILHAFFNRIESGEVFKDGELVSSISEDIEGLPTVQLKLCTKSKNTNQKVLRIMFPDKQGFYPTDKKCSNLWKMQTETPEY